MKKFFKKFNKENIIYIFKEFRYKKFFVTIYSVAATVTLIYKREDIFSSGLNFINHPFRGGWESIDLFVTFYFLIFLLWLYITGKYLLEESESTKKSNEKLRNAILRCPNPNIYLYYRKNIDQLVKVLEAYPSTYELKKQKAHLFLILNQLLSFVNLYINPSQDGGYIGGNIMLYIPLKTSQDDNTDKIKKLKQNSEEWLHHKGHCVESFCGVLRLEPELSSLPFAKKNKNKPGLIEDIKSSTVDGKKSEEEQKNTEKDVKSEEVNSSKQASQTSEGDKNISKVTSSTGKIIPNSFKPLTLAIRYDDDLDKMKYINAPGAPQAAVLGEYLFKDVHNKDAYNSLEKIERDHMIEYWKSMHGIKSIYSIAIPYDWVDSEDANRDNKPNIIGVLNIHCNTLNMLDTVTEYNVTFLALMHPFLKLLSPKLKEFYGNYIKKI